MSYYSSPADRYLDEVRDVVAAGAEFADLHVAGDPDRPVVRATFAWPDGALRMVTADASAPDLPSILPLAPAAAWDEREAADGAGVRFAGHSPLRPLLRHDAPLESWIVPVSGPDVHQVAVGPIHAGVIESGHFRFHVVGDRILHLDPRLFYKHRGLERLAAGRDLEGAMACVRHACMACSVANAVAYALACEELLGVDSARLAHPRTVLLELERLWSHLNDVAAICAGVGMAAGNHLFAALTERARQLNARVGGHRFLRGAVAVGQSTLALGAGELPELRAELRDLADHARTGWKELAFNSSFQDRLGGIGVVGADLARRLGATGPALRAAGVPADVRALSPALAYAGFQPVVADGAAGDVASRFEQRGAELWQTLALLDDLLATPVEPVSVPASRAAGGVAARRVESPRGATLCVVDARDGRIRRLRLRTGSYANWPAVAHAAAGELLPDFPLINKSFELCYACADR
jgi:Ni,Fe-hydrogenase III large subunit